MEISANMSSSTVFSVSTFCDCWGSTTGGLGVAEKSLAAPTRPVVLSRWVRRSWFRSFAFLEFFLAMAGTVLRWCRVFFCLALFLTLMFGFPTEAKRGTKSFEKICPLKFVGQLLNGVMSVRFPRC